MRKTKKIIFWVVLVLVCANVGFAIGYVLFNEMSGAQRFVGVAVGIISGIIISAIHIILHEVGHFVGGKIGGYKLYSFRVGFVKIVRVNGKLKLSFQKLGNKYGGVCQMYPSGNEKPSGSGCVKSSGNAELNFRRFVSGGLVASIICTAILATVVILKFFVEINAFVFLACACGFILVFGTLMINISTTVNVVGMTDGMFLKSLREKSPEGICAVKTLNLQSMFMAGIRPRDVSLEIVEDFPLLRDDDVNRLVMFSNQLACYIDRKDEKKVIEIANRLEENLEFLPSICQSQILADLFFVEAVYKHDIEKARGIYEKIIVELSKELDISVLRVMVTYCAVVLKDIEKARELAKHKTELQKSATISGIAIMEGDIIDELVNQTI